MLSLTRRPAGVTGMSERDQRLLWRIAALLLDYPGSQTIAMTDQLAAAATELPAALRAPILEFLREFCDADPLQLAAQYVETFDMRRRRACT